MTLEPAKKKLKNAAEIDSDVTIVSVKRSDIVSVKRSDTVTRKKEDDQKEKDDGAQKSEG